MGDNKKLDTMDTLADYIGSGVKAAVKWDTLVKTWWKFCKRLFAHESTFISGPLLLI